jgi:hypothetical protein
MKVLIWATTNTRHSESRWQPMSLEFIFGAATQSILRSSKTPILVSSGHHFGWRRPSGGVESRISGRLKIKNCYATLNRRPPRIANFSHRAHHTHQFRGKLHMAKIKAKFATRVSFRVRRDGLYRLINRGRWRRVARRSKTLQLRFRLGRLVIEQGSGKSAGDNGVSQAVDQVLKRLRELDGIVEVQRTHRSVRVAVDLDSAAGFLIRVPGIGPILAIKPAGVRNWVHGAVPFRRVLAELDGKGQLIRGADGKTTRQVVVPGLGRGRYYCFKTTKTRLPAGDRSPEVPSRQQMKPSPPPAVAPTPLSVLTSDDDWGWGTRTVSEESAAGGRGVGPSNPLSSLQLRGRRTRDMGSVTTRRGYRTTNGGWG